MFNTKPHHHLRSYRRRLLCEALEARTLLSVALTQATSAAQRQTLADLPVAAQQAISSAIGQDQSAYHAASAAAGVTLANPANGFTAQVQSGALHVSAGSDTWDMSLMGLGYGGAIQPVGTAKTSTNGNRVDCNYGTVDEWYVNGPQGLEQGFTVAPQPDASGPLTGIGRQVGNLSYLPQFEASGSLTVELALGGDLVGTVNAAGNGLTLTAPNGPTALGYTGLSACDVTGKTLPASLEVRADGGHQDLLIHVNAFGAQGRITIDPFVQEAKLTASDGAAGSSFGESVSISGSTVVVGSSLGFVGGFVGVAYVFTESGSGWTQTAKLTPSDGEELDGFGTSVSIDGNTVVVGATQTYSSRAGAAYLFTEPTSGWTDMTQTAKLTSSDGGAWLVGAAVSISGNTVVVGANQLSSGGPGAAYVFMKSGSRWTQTAKLTASDGAAKDEFGYSAVSINASTIVVGAPAVTIFGGSNNQGAAYVFTGSGSGWSQTAELTASDGAAHDGFGYSVSISSNTIVVGATHATADGNDDYGAAYVSATPTPLPLPLIVNATDWTSAGLTPTLGSDGNLHVYTTGTTTDAVPPCPPAGVSNIEITGRRYTNLTIDSTNGNPIPAGGLTYSGGGGLIITGSGTVALSGTNTYTGGTTVSSGTLLINAASALPGGGSLTVDAGGTFIFDPSSTGASIVTSATTAVPVTANVVSSVRASSATIAADVVKPSTSGHNLQLPIVPPAALQPLHFVPAVGLGTQAKRIAGNLAWLALAANNSDTSDQQRNKDVAILTLETVFAEYGR